MLWLLLGLLLVILVLMGLLLLMRKDLRKSESEKDSTYLSNLKFLAEMNSQLLKQNQNLFDRTQAADLPSYLAMTHSTGSSAIPSDDYYPQDDGSEYARLVAAAGGAGIGEVLMDEAGQDGEFLDMANELGIAFKQKES